MFHAQSVYGELANVPFFLRGPGVPAGLRVKETVRGIDLMPTLLDLAGIPVPKGLQGETVTGLFDRSGSTRPRPAVMEKVGRKGTEPGVEYESVALLLDGWKLIHHRVRPPARPEFELFDHRTDPLDLRDVAARNPEVVARLTRELDAWRRMADAARLKPDAATAREVSAEELERLRALGYVQ
jgi:iduronate 2-sulfatase